jgi:hypothetical protein
VVAFAQSTMNIEVPFEMAEEGFQSIGGFGDVFIVIIVE